MGVDFSIHSDIGKMVLVADNTTSTLFGLDLELDGLDSRLYSGHVFKWDLFFDLALLGIDLGLGKGLLLDLGVDLSINSNIGKVVLVSVAMTSTLLEIGLRS